MYKFKDLITWPKYYSGYDPKTGDSVFVKVSFVKCPTCRKSICHIYSGRVQDNETDGRYCRNCGRDLAKPFTDWDKFKLRLSCNFFDKKWMAEYPIGYIKEVKK